MASTNLDHALTTASVIVAAKDQVSSDLAGEAVILNLQTGKYYGLARVAARIWELLKTPTRVANIRDTIVRGGARTVRARPLQFPPAARGPGTHRDQRWDRSVGCTV